MPPVWWTDRKERGRIGKIILKEIAAASLRRIPFVGMGFEVAEGVRDAVLVEFRTSGPTESAMRRHALDPAQGAELLAEIQPAEARETVQEALGSPDARESVRGLPPAQREELSQRLAAIPGDLRAFGRPVEGEADLMRVLAGERARRFNPGDRTSDDHFILERKLGAGAFGEVWSARDRFTGATRALKFCLDPALVSTLRNEIRSILHLYETLDDRAGLVQFHPPALTADPPYLVMEYCERGDLLDLMKVNCEVPPWERSDELLALMRGPVEALARAHAAGIVHRDIKPGNILIGADGKARLADFGLARLTVEKNMDGILRAEKSGRSSQMGMGVAGTALYMAPEVKRGAVDPRDLAALRRADVYSLGVTLIQLLSGNPTLEAGHLPKIVRLRIPTELRDLIQAATEPEPADRLQNAGALSQILQRMLRVNFTGEIQLTDSVTAPADPDLTADEMRNRGRSFSSWNKHAEQVDDSQAAVWFRKAAAAGDALSMFHLGAMYHRGKGVQKNEIEATQWFRRAAEAGDAESMHVLGLHHANGIGVMKDEAEAVRWYRKAAEVGVADSMFSLGVMHESGRGVRKDEVEAVRWYRKAAEAGAADGMVRLGAMYANGSGVEQDEAEAAGWFHRAAELGNADGIFYLGVLYAEGRGVEKDDTEAVRWYRKAAEAGHLTGMFNLGVRYENGHGVEKDNREAVRWYRKAAEAGYADGMLQLGLMYVDGTLVDKDEAIAARWYRRAAEANNAFGMFNLANMYADGRGVEKDETEAVQWYRKAAEAGDADAMVLLGAMYADGKGVGKDEAEAVRWYRKAAEAGDSSASLRLGFIHEAGLGGEANEEEAVYWFREAAEAGEVEGMLKLAEMYERGRGVEVDEGESDRWYRNAVDAGNTDGRLMRKLAEMYAAKSKASVPEHPEDWWDWEDLDFGSDRLEADWWYAKAAGAGDTDAMCLLADKARGAEAFLWYLKAAERGITHAMYKLGIMYAHSGGGPEDDREAVRWFREAAQAGDARAQEALRRKGLV